MEIFYAPPLGIAEHDLLDVLDGREMLVGSLVASREHGRDVGPKGVRAGRGRPGVRVCRPRQARVEDSQGISLLLHTQDRLFHQLGALREPHFSTRRFW